MLPRKLIKAEGVNRYKKGLGNIMNNCSLKRHREGQAEMCPLRLLIHFCMLGKYIGKRLQKTAMLTWTS